MRADKLDERGFCVAACTGDDRCGNMFCDSRTGLLHALHAARLPMLDLRPDLRGV
jgi:hypothetical protein